MKHSRRSFISFLTAAISSATLDPEALLWRPGAKLISIPAPVIAAVQFSDFFCHTMLPSINARVWETRVWERFALIGNYNITGGLGGYDNS